MRYLVPIILGVMLLLSNCIGTDIIDDTMAELDPNLPVSDSTATDSTLNQLTGTLQGSGGYESKGTVTLSQDDQGNITLSTGDDFQVEFAAGTFLYLSNDVSGSITAASGLEIADVSEKRTGAQSFDVTAIDAEVTLDTYRYVIVLCKPFQLTFGFAELQ